MSYEQHAPAVRDLAETVVACLSRGAEVNHLLDEDDPLHATFKRMVAVFAQHEGVDVGTLNAAVRDFCAPAMMLDALRADQRPDRPRHSRQDQEGHLDLEPRMPARTGWHSLD